MAFRRVWAIVMPFPLLKPDAVPEVRAAVQVNVVPAVALESEILVVAPGQIDCEAGVAMATGIGFTVITTAVGEPLQPFAEAVIV